MQNKTQNTVHDIFALYFEGKSNQKLAYTLSKKLEHGHICIDIDNSPPEDKDYLSLNKIESSKYVTQDAINNIKPFVLHNNKVYLHRYYYYETNILERINQLINTGKNNRKRQINSIIKNKKYILDLFELKHEENLEKDLLIPWQLIAVLSSILNNFSIITGGPGTGKTTTITKLLAILFKINPDISVALAAPTGKAAARLNESLITGANNLKHLSNDIVEKFKELKAQTIHRLLGVKYESTEFVHNKENPLKYDLIIIDESSMIDVAMMSKLLDSIQIKSKLVLLGDKDQLSSIEAGSIFGDLCKSQAKINSFLNIDFEFFNNIITTEELQIPPSFATNNGNILTGTIVELQRSYRFKSTEGIGKFSNLVIHGISDEQQIFEPFNECVNTTQCVKITEDFNELDFYKMISHYQKYIKEKNIDNALKYINEVKVLCAVKEGEYGVSNYNNKIENYLKSRGLLNPKQGFYHNQIIMISTNDYSLGLYNGDIGIVRNDPASDQLKAYFQSEDKIINYPVANINNYKTVFAMTIHKSQGSEFENIIVILPENQENTLISRELIYTAVTRAKNNVLLISKKDILIKAVNNKTQRISGIMDRI